MYPAHTLWQAGIPGTLLENFNVHSASDYL